MGSPRRYRLAIRSPGWAAIRVDIAGRRPGNALGVPEHLVTTNGRVHRSATRPGAAYVTRRTDRGIAARRRVPGRVALLRDWRMQTTVLSRCRGAQVAAYSGRVRSHHGESVGLQPVWSSPAERVLPGRAVRWTPRSG